MIRPREIPYYIFAAIVVVWIAVVTVMILPPLGRLIASIVVALTILWIWIPKEPI